MHHAASDCRCGGDLRGLLALPPPLSCRPSPTGALGARRSDRFSRRLRGVSNTASGSSTSISSAVIDIVRAKQLRGAGRPAEAGRASVLD
jgi:hypothetical protein